MTELDFDTQCKLFEIPKPIYEFKFSDRKWRVDMAWPDYKLCVEIEGGIWTGGRHIHPTGFEKDREKYNTLTIMGFSLLRFSPEELKNGYAGRMIRNFIEGRERPLRHPKVAKVTRVVG